MKHPIIYINGVSSAGKSTLAEGLQQILDGGYLHVGIDAFLEMLPAAITDDPSAYKENFPRFERGFHAAIAAMVGEENNVIVDHVLSPHGLSSALEALSGCDVVFVGVHCNHDELDRRERERGDRRIGQARQQLSFTHRGALYDVEVDTSVLHRAACVDTVVQYLHARKGRSAFASMRDAGPPH